MEKHIANIVFYKYYEGTELVQKSCVFYSDGTIVEGTYQDGLKACRVVADSLEIKTVEAFKELINMSVIHTMTKSDFEKRFADFVGNEAEEVKEETETKAKDETDTDKNAIEESTAIPTPIIIPITESKSEDTHVSEEEQDLESESDNETDTATDEADEADNTDEAEETDEIIADGIESSTDEIEDAELLEEEPKKDSFFKRAWKKIKKTLKVGALVVTTAAVGLLGTSCTKLNKESKTGTIARKNSTSMSDFVKESRKLDTNNNDDYDTYNYADLRTVTHNSNQKEAMQNARNVLNDYNGKFANAYVEEGKTIKPALTFEEVIALQQAYNDYSKEEIKAIFNGAEVDAAKMSRNYKDASLQLMGAYVIENNEHPVDISALIESEEGKDFYNRYHKMFLEAKAASTYEEKAAKVSEFYKAVRADFPITQEVRTEGIAHAGVYKSIESYKLAVTPMIAAAEMMYQNLETDVTLDDSEIDFINDIGLCNYADDKFERIETITLSATEDNTNPLYTQYKNSIISEQLSKSQYATEDEYRDLSKLDAFDKAVNWHFEIIGEGTYSEDAESYTTYETYTSSSTKYRTEEKRTEKPITPEAKQQIDNQIAAENAQAKAAAEKAAQDKRQELQQEADKKSEEIRKEIEQENKDLDEKINQTNEQIAKNNDSNPSNDKPVNESDLGHGVKFDDDHSDGNGNLNDSVENITIDPQGAVKHDDPLPDPNETGAKFDSQAGTFYGDNGYTFSGQVYEYNVPTSYAEAVDSYVENLAGNEYDGEGYQYTYSN